MTNRSLPIPDRSPVSRNRSTETDPPIPHPLGGIGDRGSVGGQDETLTDPRREPAAGPLTCTCSRADVVRWGCGCDAANPDLSRGVEALSPWARSRAPGRRTPGMVPAGGALGATSLGGERRPRAGMPPSVVGRGAGGGLGRACDPCLAWPTLEACHAEALVPRGAAVNDLADEELVELRRRVLGPFAGHQRATP